MKRTLFSILFFVVFASGCTVYQIDSKDMSQDLYVSKANVDDVEYLQTTDKPYTQIAEISVTTERRQPIKDVLPKLKQEAGMLGADAIIDVQSDATDLWKKVAHEKIVANAYIRTVYTAKAVVWK